MENGRDDIESVFGRIEMTKYEYKSKVDAITVEVVELIAEYDPKKHLLIESAKELAETVMSIFGASIEEEESDMVKTERLKSIDVIQELFPADSQFDENRQIGTELFLAALAAEWRDAPDSVLHHYAALCQQQEKAMQEQGKRKTLGGGKSND